VHNPVIKLIYKDLKIPIEKQKGQKDNKDFAGNGDALK
jgi:hypothetical protein